MHHHHNYLAGEATTLLKGHTGIDPKGKYQIHDRRGRTEEKFTEGALLALPLFSISTIY
jgi:hypothetical protein